MKKKQKMDFPGVPSAGSCPGGTCLPDTHGPAAESADSDASTLSTTNELGSTRRRTNRLEQPSLPPKKLLTQPHTRLNPLPSRLSTKHEAKSFPFSGSVSSLLRTTSLNPNCSSSSFSRLRLLGPPRSPLARPEGACQPKKRRSEEAESGVIKRRVDKLRRAFWVWKQFVHGSWFEFVVWWCVGS